MTQWPVKGDTHPFVRLAQQRLTALGFILNDTGVYDDGVADAVARFQQFYNLPVTGAIDGPTMILLWRLTRRSASPD